MRGRTATCLAVVLSTSLVLSGAMAQVVVAAGPRSDVTGSGATQRTVALGVSTPDGRDLGQLDAFRESIGGHRVATWTIWSQWGRPDFSPFPTAAAVGARARGAVPMIWWEPISPDDWSDPTFTRHQNIIDGDHDDYIRAFALDAKAYRSTVLLRFAHQANSDYLPWAWGYSKTDDNTVGTFIAAWRHVRDLFREVGALNVKFVWSIATQTCAGDCLTRRLGYPGDRWVDYMAFTWENWGEAQPGSVVPSEPTVSMLDGFRPVVARLAAVSDKPIVAVAMASSPDGGTRAAWIRRGYHQVYRYLPRVVAIMYLNVDLSGPPAYHRDWSLSGESLEAYAAVAAQARFQGRITPWWRSS